MSNPSTSTSPDGETIRLSLIFKDKDKIFNPSGVWGPIQPALFSDVYLSMKSWLTLRVMRGLIVSLLIIASHHKKLTILPSFLLRNTETCICLCYHYHLQYSTFSCSIRNIKKPIFAMNIKHNKLFPTSKCKTQSYLFSMENKCEVLQRNILKFKAESNIENWNNVLKNTGNLRLKPLFQGRESIPLKIFKSVKKLTSWEKEINEY